MTKSVIAGLPAQLDNSKLRALIDCAKTLTAEQLLWSSGYLAGMASGSAGAPTGSSAGQVVILYASQTGNGVGVSKKLQQALAQAGIGAEVFNALDYRKAQLKKAAAVLIVASTHGEGDVPDTAQEFAEFLNSNKAKVLKSLQYSVLALGDSSYSHYCQVGRDFDARLAELGAQEIVPRQECDVDYAADAATWIEQVTNALQQTLETTSSAPVVVSLAGGNDYSRGQPWQAEVLVNQVITGRGSSKQTRHLELSLEESGMEFLPGDSIGVLTPNPVELVDEILATLKLDPQAQVPGASGESVTVRDALIKDYEIVPIARPVIQNYVAIQPNDQLIELLEDDHKQELTDWLYSRDLLDLLVEQPLAGLTAEQLVGLLRPIQPRLYSIASSQLANSDEVHLTVATVEYEARGRQRSGVATGWIANHVVEGETLGIYRHENPLFRLPEDSQQPVIMIGPGTGVAPFRAFLEEREAQGAEGRNWLFFGDRNFTTDFLYQREWQAHLASDLLTRIDLAFSRDQAERIYVQQRMLEQSHEFYRWLEEGACVYVCGDATRMASDVHAALLEIIQKEGGLSAESAADYVSLMQRERRYQRDVY
ncbi:MAG: assimilatory sulfite reductase (NADPH) flavoprotein subunit [Gammaproteobacteria bacterium]|nr:MAG: assimilatory sulfite reductase (NADPH) flavoprotein subunit [Gammaproteobacteria bacterium]RLA13680.1 MAG: assimilatory sulfite reductase (NADPH) flavoprotein subunit [Gammaproteobacteria bacterium]